MEHMLVRGVTQERASLPTRTEGRLHERNSAPAGDQTADIEAPVRVQVIDHPVVALLVGETLTDVLEMSGPVLAGAGWSQIPDDLAGRHTEGREQAACAMTDVLELAFRRFSRMNELAVLIQDTGLRWLRRILALEDLHPGFLVAGQHQPALLGESFGLAVQLANRLGFGVKVWVVAIEPVDTLVGFEIGGREDALDRDSTHSPAMGVVDDGAGQFVQSPGGVGRVVVFGFAAGQSDNEKTFIGGKSSGVCRSAGRLEVR